MSYEDFELDMRAIEIAAERQWSQITASQWEHLIEVARNELLEQRWPQKRERALRRPSSDRPAGR